ncbi:hypothetical protein PE066_17860 [Ramlibacter tataouinensis]|uniref:hypothetical protein n=1 Tax=Ramlibacter tataouinensis TaxID=94132 RepID=UPI0022F3E2F4|nr:hypothetical protein [Ramlibacter tataouinensis]WBY01306.1 hypothetical protein PE066_17860 [Ramlibacter tataouinensis]
MPSVSPLATAVIVIGATFGLALVLGALTRNTFFSLVAPLAVPVLVVATELRGSMRGDELLAALPYLAGGALLSIVVAMAGVYAGRWLRGKLSARR